MLNVYSNMKKNIIFLSKCLFYCSVKKFQIKQSSENSEKPDKKIGEKSRIISYLEDLF